MSNATKKWVSADIERFNAEYQTSIHRLEKFSDEVRRQLSTLLEKENIALAVPIQHRIKSWLSINDKVDQGRFFLKKSIFEMQDLIGLRVILLFKRDVETVAKLAEKNFHLVKQYNTADRLDDDQFGYSSFHQIIELPKSWLAIPTMRDLADIKCEIQIRTLSQHGWAEASNRFQYKSEDNVPPPLKRAISRISAVLEIVDLEFERLLEERQAYKREIFENIDDKVSDEPLNVDLLIKALDDSLPAQNKDSNEEYSALLDNLTDFEIKSLKDLSDLIKKYSEKAIEFDKGIVEELKRKGKSAAYSFNTERIKKGVYFTHVGLIRKMLTFEAGEDWWEAIKKRNRPSN